MRENTLSLTLAAALAAGCGPVDRAGAERLPVTGGEIDEDSAHDGIVGLYSTAGYVIGSFVTGALVAPRLVVSSAHVGLEAAPGSLSVFFGPQIDSAVATISVEEVHAHPDYVPAEPPGSPTGPDLAVYVLERDAPVEVAPIPVLPESLALNADDVGSFLLVVGYGCTSASGADEGTRRAALTRVEELLGEDEGYTFEAVHTVSSPGGPCFGDGPMLVEREGVEFVATSGAFLESECAEAWSVHLAAYESFVEGFIEPPTTCSDASACDSGFCADGYCCDDACESECARCDAPGREGRCAPAEDGQPCSGGSCSGGVCSPPVETDADADADAGADADTDGDADTDEDADGGEEERHAASGGCRAAGGAPTEIAPAIVALALALARRRRCRGSSV